MIKTRLIKSLILFLLLNLQSSFAQDPSRVAHWDFNAGSGSMLFDVTGNGFNGTLFNGPIWSTGVDSGGLQFDGVDDNVSISHNTSLEGMSQLSLSAWFKISSVSIGDPMIIDKWINGGNSSSAAYFLGIGVNGSISWNIRTTNTNVDNKSGSGYDDNQWHHVVVTYDGSLSRCYVDGNVIESFSRSGSVGTTGTPVRIGSGADHVNFKYFPGLIDEVMIYNRAISSGSIDSIYRLHNPQNTAAVLSLVGISGSGGTLSGDIGINYMFSDVAQDAHRVVDFMYSVGSTNNWVNVGQSSLGNNVYQLPGSYSFSWHSRDQLDSMDVDSVYVRFAVGDSNNIEQWATKSSMKNKRYFAGVGIVGDKLYVVGGGSDNASPLNVVEEYDLLKDTWSSKAPLQVARKGVGVGVLNGKVYAVGGWNGTYHTSVEVYNPLTNSWSYVASMNTARTDLMVVVMNGKLYALGGRTASAWFSTNEVYDPVLNTWTTKSSMSIPRDGAWAGVVDGKIYVIGGYTTGATPAVSFEIYDPVLDTWQQGGSIPVALGGNTGGVLNSKIYIAEKGSSELEIHRYDPLSNQWKVFSSSVPTSRGEMARGNGVYKGTLYLIGGLTGSSSTTTSTIVETFTPALYSNYVTGGPLHINNINPQVTSTPNTNATEDILYSYNVDATSTAGGPLVYSLVQSPDSMVIDSVTGLILWTPRNGDVGEVTVVVAAADTAGMVASQTFSITVINTNDVPVITSTPITEVDEDSLYHYQLQVFEEDIGDILTFSLLTGPASMNVDSMTGEIMWVPGSADVGTVQVNVEVRDASNAKDTQGYVITVHHTNHPPSVPTILSPPPGAALDEKGALAWSNSTDPDSGDVVSYQLELSKDQNFSVIDVIDSNLQSTVVVLEKLTQAAKLQALTIYYWRVQAVDNNGMSSSYSSTTAYFLYNPTIVGLENELVVKNSIYLKATNPLSGKEGIVAFNNPVRQKIKIEIHDVYGNAVQRIADKLYSRGQHKLRWTHSLESGVYILQLAGEKQSAAKKILITR